METKKGLGLFGKTLILLIVLGALIIGVLFAWHYVTNDSKEEPNKIEEITIIEETLTDIQELAAAKYTYTDSLSFSDPRTIPFINAKIPLTTKSFRVKVTGEIRAYFDMKENKPEITEDKVIITLPEIKITQSLEDKIIEEHNNVFNPISIKDQSDFVKNVKVIMENRAIKKGIMKEARTSAEKMIKVGLEGLLNEGQTLEIKQADEAKKADDKYAKEIEKKAEKAKKKVKAVDEPLE